MWTTAEILSKTPDGLEYVIAVQYGTDDPEPLTRTMFVRLGVGQDESTLKAAIVQQLTDLNAAAGLVQSKQKTALDMAVAAIPLGLVEISIDIEPLPLPVEKPPVVEAPPIDIGGPQLL